VQIVECLQRTPEWWLARKGVPTASAFDRIVTPKKFERSTSRTGYACQLVAERFDKFYSQSPEYQSVAMAEGIRLEPEARAYYEFHRNVDVQEIGFAMTDDGRFGCSPDAMVGTEGALELKAPQPATHVRYLHAGGLPDEYRPQCEGHLIVTGRPWVDFLSYCPGLPPLLVRLEPNEKTEILRKELEEFWGLYQEILARVEARHREYVDEEIDRRAAENPTPLKSFVA
jgi:hypothetical protein